MITGPRGMGDVLLPKGPGSFEWLKPMYVKVLSDIGIYM